jgi:hypothetical protein
MVISSVAFFFYLPTNNPQSKLLVGMKNSPYLCINHLRTYLVVTYFSNLYIYLYMKPISYRISYQGETKY